MSRAKPTIDQVQDLQTELNEKALKGANSDINSLSAINGGISTPEYIDFNVLGENLDAVGRLTWNDTDGTLNLGLKGGNVVLQIGQEQLQRATNLTGQTIPNGSVVYISGAQGNRVTITRAQANAESTSSKTFGVATEQILNNQSGFVTTSGLVRGLNTLAFTEGAALWLSDTVLGGITQTRPTAPNHSVLIGWCVRSNNTDGIIYVHVMNGYELEELHDVLLTNKQDGDILAYEASTGLWKNKVFNGVTQEQLDLKADINHSHIISNVTGLQTALDGKAPTSHTHTIANITNLQNELDGKANSVHSHSISNVTGLQTALDGKASTSHTHIISDVTGLQTALDGKASTTDLAAKQDLLVSNTNIKTINGNSILGSGNLSVGGGVTQEQLDLKQDLLVSPLNIKTLNGINLLGSGNITVAQSFDDLSDVTINAPEVGQVASYTAVSEVIPNPSYDPNWANVTILLKAEVTEAYDTVSQSTLFGQTGTVIKSNEQAKFGTYSVKQTGASNGLNLTTANSSTRLNFGTNDFTYELFTYPTVISGEKCFIYPGSTTASVGFMSLIQTTTGFDLYINGYKTFGTLILSTGLGTYTANQWNHIAVVREFNNWYLFVNGQIVGATINSISVNTPTALVYFMYGPESNSFTGYYDEMRITKGVARYNQNFTVPQYEFSDNSAPQTYTTNYYWTNKFPEIKTVNGNSLLGTGNVDLSIGGATSIARSGNLQSDLGSGRIMYWLPQGNTATINAFNSNAIAQTGTLTASNFATTNYYTYQKRTEVLVTTASTTAVVGERYATALWTVGGPSDNLGGFFLKIRFGIATGASLTTRRNFVGMSTLLTAPTDAALTQFGEFVGVGTEQADANWNIVYRGANGVLGKIDLGSNFLKATTDRTKVYELTLYSATGTTQSVDYQFTDLTTGISASGTITNGTATLPSTTTALAPRIASSVGGASSVIGISFNSMYIEDIMDY